MMNSNPLNAFVRLISFEGVFQPQQPGFHDQKLTLSEAAIEEEPFDMAQIGAEMRRKHKRLARFQDRVDAEVESKGINL